MRKHLFLLCLTHLAFISCNTVSVEEQYNEALLLHGDGLYKEALKKYAQISIDSNANWKYRCNALFHMSLIKDVVNKDRKAAIKYINKCIEIAAPNEYSFLYAYKGDYSMHYGVPDSAIYYCKKALSLPYDNRIEYVVHYALYNSYRQKGLIDSAICHKQLFDKVCEEGKLDAYSALTDDAFNKELQSELEIQFKDDDNKNIGYLITAAFTMIFTIFFVVKKWHKGNPAITGKPDELVNRLESCKQCFEQTETFLLLNDLRIKEKELYKTKIAESEFIKKEILRCFNEVNAILIDKYRLSADELMCCDCSYLGISNNIIAYMSNSSPAAIRKRKERLKLKLSQMHYSAFFNREKAINSNTVTH